MRDTTLTEFMTADRTLMTDGGVVTADDEPESDESAADDDDLGAYEFTEHYNRETYIHRETGLCVELVRQASTDQWDDSTGWFVYVRPSEEESTLGLFEYERFSLPPYTAASETAREFIREHPDGVVE